MGVHSRLNEYNFREEVVPLMKQDMQVTSLVAAAFSKADMENTRLLYAAYPLVCLDLRCWYNGNVNANYSAVDTAKRLVQIHQEAGVSLDYGYNQLLMVKMLGFSDSVAHEALQRAMSTP